MLTEIRLLGRFSVRRGGEEIPPSAFRQRLVRILVRILVVKRGEFVPQDVLTEALWPRRAPADPAANLKVLVNLARRALGDPTLIRRGAGGYSFSADDRCVVDTEVFMGGIDAGRERLAAGQAGAALKEFRSALDVWTGEPLPEDTYEEWAQDHRVRLARVYVAALEGAAEAALAVRDPGEAVPLAEQAVTREPLRESAHLLLVRALAASGDTAAALAAFERMRRLLAEELGLDPSAQALQLQMRILRGEPLGPPTARPHVSSWPARKALPFVGRDPEIERILDALGAAPPGTVAVAGPGGTGKSRLLAEVAARSGVPVLGTQGFLADRDDAWGLARSLLREGLALELDVATAIPDRAAEALAEIVPELHEIRPIRRTATDLQSRRALALEGGVRLMEAVAAGGALVVVDDLQWADATSLAFLGSVRRRVAALGMIVAYRPEEVADEGQVAAFLETLAEQAGRFVRMKLGPLTREAILQLVGDAELGDTIAKETDGTPFAIAELIRELAEQGAIQPDVAGRWRARRPDAVAVAAEAARSGKRRAIWARAQRQPARRRELLFMLALLGRQAPARLLTSAAGREQADILADLDRLAAESLVRLGDQGWCTAHDLISETIAEALQRPERGCLHDKLGHALLLNDGDPAEIAQHLKAAGDGEAAAASFARAARQRLDRFASEEAKPLAEAGLALGPAPSVRPVLLEVRGEARARLGDVLGAREDLREALAEQEPGPARAPILARLATLTSGAESYMLASELIELALAEAGADRGARARALAAGSFIDRNMGRLDRAEARSDEALELFRQIRHAPGMAEMLEARALNALAGARFVEAASTLDRASLLFRDCGNLFRASVPRAARAWTLMWMGRPEEGLPDAEEAVELARLLGHAEGEGFCLWFKSEVLAAMGRSEAAKESADAALAIALRIGHRELTAVSFLGLGLAREGSGNLEAAESEYRQAFDAGEGIQVPRSGAASRLASVLIALGRLDEAERYLTLAFSEGCPLTDLLARLAQAELAMARRAPDAEGVAAAARESAKAALLVMNPSHPRELIRVRAADGTRA